MREGAAVVIIPLADRGFVPVSERNRVRYYLAPHSNLDKWPIPGPWDSPQAARAHAEAQGWAVVKPDGTPDDWGKERDEATCDTQADICSYCDDGTIQSSESYHCSWCDRDIEADPSLVKPDGTPDDWGRRELKP